MANHDFAADIDAIVFDVVGTLVDEDATLAEVARRVADAVGVGDTAELHRRWTTALDERMGAVVSGAEPWRPHRELVADAATDAITGLGATPSAETHALVSSVDRLYRAWSDVADATAGLRRGRLVAGVSNGDLDALARLANTNRISWDVALSTGTVHAFKPAPDAYRYAVEALALDPARTLFAAAHPWDLRAAAEFGFRTAYVARPGAERPTADDRFDLAVDNLAELYDVLG